MANSLTLETIELHALANRIQPFCSHAKMLTMITLLFIVCTGCVRRRMTVRTSPPGATVSVDNQLIGTSPAATSFEYYGTREVRIEREGFRTETVLRKIKPPWYQLPGLDFVSETLWPGEIRDERIIDIELVPQVIEPSEDVLNRAEALRNQSRSGVMPQG
ncbi:putative membrane lipoprotein [Rhodopirellula islandica]|uniref:Membrane lipoprotein n=1 Tax=Rhodopirellula islandica TaxID=595434 RepID=A0A0J1B6Y6_RHOIS|nr:putative membrane lipoprotein [Rhodopirellula islandica]